MLVTQTRQSFDVTIHLDAARIGMGEALQKGGVAAPITWTQIRQQYRNQAL
ncbi:MAG: hypothetical protein MI924_32715 [Chloroflexales bacterium]|nr:hypothetical protein [Chloroflexales bacterium]